MANKNLFKSVSSVPVADAVNAAGGVAYSQSNEAALASLCCTGTFNGTFYASAEETLTDVLVRAGAVRPEFLAKLAVYARRSAFMKDAPAVLLAVLMNKDINLFKSVFPRVIDNGRMLRTFCQVVRSGAAGRKSFGSAPKRMIHNWFNQRTDRQVFEDSVGNDPSLVDVIKMVHPKPTSPSRESLYAYLLGKPVKGELPQVVLDFEAFKIAEKGAREVPNIPFQMLTALDLSTEEWTEIARTAKWHMTRMNLNTFNRHGVFANKAMVTLVADRLRSEKDIRAVKVFPYQLFVAYKNTSDGVPVQITNALQDAMEVATNNVPKLSGKVYVAVDCSGSMTMAVTGNRGSATSKVSCNDVASLMAACIMRRSDDVTVYRFDTTAQRLSLNPRDSVVTNTEKIGTRGGGTDCGVVLRDLNAQGALGDVVVVLSDNESWCNPHGQSHTNLMREWTTFKRRNPRAKLVCVDLAANTTTQAPSNRDVLNVAGFSDQVFTVVSSFLTESDPNAWVNTIMETSLS